MRTTTVLLSISSASAWAATRSFVSRLTAASCSRFASSSTPCCFFFNDTATTEIYTLSLHDALPIFGVVGLIVIWYLAVWYQVVDPVLLPSPVDTFRALWNGMAGGRLGFDFMRTLERTILAILIAAAIAIPLGVALGASERVYRSVEFVIDFFRSTPASAMFPLFLVLFGVGDKTKVSVAAFGAALVILFNVAYGVMN